MTSGRTALLLVVVLILGLGIIVWFLLGGGEAESLSGVARTDDGRALGGPAHEARRSSGEEGGGDSNPTSTSTSDRTEASVVLDGRIEGWIDAPKGFDFASVRVKLEEAWREKDDRLDFQLTARPDASGAFRFEDLDPGRRHVLTIEAPGRRIRPYRSLIGKAADLAAVFDLSPVLGASPRLLDPSGLELNLHEGRFVTLDQRQFERAGLEQVSDFRTHGLAPEDLDRLESGCGLFAVPKDIVAAKSLALDLSFECPGYRSLRATVGLVELSFGSSLPGPIFTLEPAPDTCPVRIDLRYADGGLPGGLEGFRIQRYGGWNFEDCYALDSFDLSLLPVSVFRLIPGPYQLVTRDGRVAREFTVGQAEREVPQVVSIRIERGADIVFELPGDRGPYRLAAPVRGSNFDHAREVEAGRFEYRDLEPGNWCFAVTDRRGRRVEGLVELKGGDTFTWRPFAE